MSLYPWLSGIYRSLTQRVLQSNLHHGLILQGKRGTGKRQLANELANVLLCTHNDKPCGQCQSCRLFSAGTHPDFHFLEGEKSIGVDQIREAIAKLNTTSQLMTAKVLFINEAQKMTMAACNALLKTLEEPTHSTYIILSIEHMSQLLPTVLSRCEKHLITVDSIDTVQQWLAQGDEPVSNQLLHYYWQQPLLLQEFSQDAYVALFNALDSFVANQANYTGAQLKLFAEQSELTTDWLSNWVNQQLKATDMSPQKQQDFFALARSLANTKQKCLQQGANKELQLSVCLQHFKQALA